MTVAASAIGHTCGVKVQKVQRVQRVQRWWWRPLGADFKEGGAAGAGVFGRQDAVKKKPPISRSFFFRSNGD